MGAELIGWLPLSAMAAMVINDTVRVYYPCWITGKVSDFAVLLYFPFLLTTGFALLLWAVDRVRLRVRPDAEPFQYRLTTRRLWVALFLSGAALSAINLSVSLRDLYLELLRRVDLLDLFGGFTYTVDPTDLVALVMLYPAWRWGRRFAVERSPAKGNGG